jgi:P4 family phage/plasmid primase-like protien
MAVKTGSPLHRAAMLCIDNQISVFPCKDKRPTVKSWSPYQKALMPLENIPAMFNGAPQMAIVCGAVSGNLEVIDFDLKYDLSGTLYDRYIELVDNIDPSIRPRIVIQTTPSGGLHWLYRCNEIEGNQKLAQTEKNLVLIETRGEGGYIIGAPSDGYKLQGILDYNFIPLLTPHERAILLAAARSLTEKKPEEFSSPELKESAVKVGWVKLPGEAFNEAHQADPVLFERMVNDAGWQTVGRQGNTIYFLRPGNSTATHSANWGHIEGRFWVWSTSTDFKNETLYTPFAVYAILYHSGNFKAAAVELFEKGYGKKAESLTQPEVIRLALQDEYGLAELYSRINENKALYDHYYKKWRLYSNGIWQLDEKKAITKTLPKQLQKELFSVVKNLNSEFAKAVSRNDEQAQKEIGASIKTINRQAASLNKKATNENVQALAQSMISVLTTELDQQPYLINCKNGTYNCDTYSFHAHQAKDLLSKQCNVDYDITADCPEWKAFLETIFEGNKELISFIARAVGYTFTGLSDMQAVLFAYGSGGNGKTIFFYVIQEILKDYYQPIPIDALLSKQKNNTDDYHLATLKGARCIVASEMPEDRRLNESQIKDLTGGEHILARIPHGMPFSFVPTHTLWMFGNHKPVIKGTDEGIWRRIHLIPFTYTIPKEKRKDKNILMRSFKKEFAGIFNWAMEGLKDYAANGLNPPDVVCEATSEYKKEANNFWTFVEEKCRPVNKMDISLKTPLKDLYESYINWCMAQNPTEQSIYKTSKALSAYLRQEGYQLRESDGNLMHVFGIALG